MNGERRVDVKTQMKILVFIGFAVFTCGVTLIGEISPTMTLGSAHAVVGRPHSPVSYAGVARRTTRRAVAATTAAVATTTAATAAAASASAAVPNPAAPPPPPATPAPPPTPTNASAVPVGTIVPALPGGCASVVLGGVSYSDCGGVFYKAAFQGENLVYVVVPTPVP